MDVPIAKPPRRKTLVPPFIFRDGLCESLTRSLEFRVPCGLGIANQFEYRVRSVRVHLEQSVRAVSVLLEKETAKKAVIVLIVV